MKKNKTGTSIGIRFFILTLAVLTSRFLWFLIIGIILYFAIINPVNELYSEIDSIEKENKEMEVKLESLKLDSISTHEQLNRCALRDKKRGLEYTDTYD